MRKRLLIALAFFLIVQQTCVYVRTQVIGHGELPEVPEALRVYQKSDDDFAFNYLSAVGHDCMRKPKGSFEQRSSQYLADYMAINQPIVDSIDWYQIGPRYPQNNASRLPVVVRPLDELPKVQPLFNLFHFGLVVAWNQGPNPQTAQRLQQALLISDLFWENSTPLNYFCGLAADLNMAWVVLEQPLSQTGSASHKTSVKDHWKGPFARRCMLRSPRLISFMTSHSTTSLRAARHASST